MTEVKICGIKDPDHLKVAAAAGARYIGLVFIRSSPRFIEPEMARLLSRTAPTGVRLIGLFADADDSWLSHVFSAVPLDMIQLHGAESPVRVQEIKNRFCVPVIKAIPIARPDDLATLHAYESVADWILFDAKSPQGGGSGQVFDWQVLKNKRFSRPWMLSGGLTVDNVQEALCILSPDVVDVSSGVESVRGIKDPSKIIQFLQTVKNL